MKTISQPVTDFWDKRFHDSFYVPAISTLRRCQEKGHYVLLLSSSPEFLVGPIAKELEVDEYKASGYDLDKKGELTSISTNVDGSFKLQYTLEVAKQRGVSLKEIAAFTDSFWDLPLMEKVGYPFAVNPDKKLKKIACEKGWESI